MNQKAVDNGLHDTVFVSAKSVQLLNANKYTQLVHDTKFTHWLVTNT